MYVSKIEIVNFRNFKETEIEFSPHMNVIIGHNNSGKTNLIKALQLIFNRRNNRSRLSVDDFYKECSDFSKPPEITLTVTIKENEDQPDDKNVIYDWLIKLGSPYKAKLTFKYFLPQGDDYDAYVKDIVDCKEGEKYNPEKCWKLVSKYYISKYVSRIYGGEPDKKEKADADMLDKFDLQFLDAIRDAERQMFYGSNTLLKDVLSYFIDYDVTNGQKMAELDGSKQAKIKQREQKFSDNAQDLLKLLTDRISKKDILEYADETGATKGGRPDFDTNVSESDLLFALRLIVGKSDYKIPIVNNGLGYNNLLFIALILAKMQMECSSHVGDNAKVYPMLAIEEPEAHLHPALQYKFLKFLDKNLKEKKQVRQIFITTHSTHITSAVNLDNIICLYEDFRGCNKVGYPGKAFNEAENKSKNYVQRFLDATKSNMLFADRVIFVEGLTEQLLIPCFAAYLGKEEDLLNKHIGIVSVDSRTFKHFLKLFQYNDSNKSTINKKVACITDADPVKKVSEKWEKCFPAEIQADDNFKSLSSHVENLKKTTHAFENIEIFHPEEDKGKTLEYELAISNPDNSLLLTNAMPKKGSNGKEGIKAMQENYEKNFDDLLSECNNEDMKGLIQDSDWPEDEKKKALVASVYYRSVENSKGEHAFMLEKQLRENLEGKDCKDFIVPDYIKNAFNFILTD